MISEQIDGQSCITPKSFESTLPGTDKVAVSISKEKYTRKKVPVTIVGDTVLFRWLVEPHLSLGIKRSKRIRGMFTFIFFMT